MSFPLYFLILPYFLFLFIWAILSLVGFYHLFRFGRKLTALILSVIYIAGSLALFQVSYAYLGAINWQTQATLFRSETTAPSLRMLDF